MDKDGEVILSKGLNFEELMTSGNSVFHIDLDFQAQKVNKIFDDRDLLKMIEESKDAKEVLHNVDHKIKNMMLSSPGYRSFDDLASKMVDCVSSGDVKMLIVEEGSENIVPTDAIVFVHYAAYWEGEHTPFDTTLLSENGAPRRFRLGVGNVLPGLEIGLTMVRGPKARFHLLLTPAVTWGRLGVLERIRRERCLFCVTLLDVQDIGAVERFNSLPSAEQKKFETITKTVEASNLDAKHLFGKRLYKKACERYHRSLAILQKCVPANDVETDEIKCMLCKVYTNLALCYIKMKAPNRAIMICDDLGRCTDINKHCKGLFYYGKGFTMLGQYEEAMKFYKKAYKLEPKNTEIGNAMADLNAVMVESAEKEKKMWLNAFTNEKDKIKVGAEKFSNVSEEFKSLAKQTCEEMSKISGYSKTTFSSIGLQKIEIDYVKYLIQDFDKLCLDENDVGGQKTYSIIKLQ